MKQMTRLALSTAIAFAVAPLGTPHADASEVNIAFGEALETLDPHNGTANAVASIASGVKERLIGFDPQINLVPMLAEMGMDVSKNPVGTGPFLFKEWVPGEHYTVTKFDCYWRDGWRKVGQVTFLTVKEAATKVAMLRSEEAQYVDTLPSERYDAVKAGGAYMTREVAGITVWTASMNMIKPEFQGVWVRQAFNLAVDKNAFLQAVHSGHGIVPDSPLDSPLAPNTAFYPGRTAYPYDLETAKALMAEAGCADGFKIQAWGRNSTAETRMPQFLQQQLSLIKVEAEIFPLEPATRSEEVFGNVDPATIEFGLLTGGWSPSRGDAGWRPRPVHATEGWIPKIYNMAFCSNPEVDAQIATGLSSADDAARGAAYVAAQNRSG